MQWMRNSNHMTTTPHDRFSSLYLLLSYMTLSFLYRSIQLRNLLEEMSSLGYSTTLVMLHTTSLVLLTRTKTPYFKISSGCFTTGNHGDGVFTALFYPCMETNFDLHV